MDEHPDRDLNVALLDPEDSQKIDSVNLKQPMLEMDGDNIALLDPEDFQEIESVDLKQPMLEIDGDNIALLDPEDSQKIESINLKQPLSSSPWSRMLLMIPPFFLLGWAIVGFIGGGNKSIPSTRADKNPDKEALELERKKSGERAAKIALQTQQNKLQELNANKTPQPTPTPLPSGSPIVVPPSAEPPVTRDSPPPVADKPPVTRDSPPPVAYKPPVGRYNPPSVTYKPPVGRYNPPSVTYKPPVGRYNPPPVADKPPVARYNPPPVADKPPAPKPSPSPLESINNEEMLVSDLPEVNSPIAEAVENNTTSDGCSPGTENCVSPQSDRSFDNASREPQPASDPYEQWLAAANGGTSVASQASQEREQLALNSEPKADYQETSQRFNSDGYPEANYQQLDFHREVSTDDFASYFDPSLPQAIVGTTAAGKLETPIFWSAGIDRAKSVQIIKLEEDLLLQDRAVAIPKGSYLTGRLDQTDDAGFVRVNVEGVLIVENGVAVAERKIPAGSIEILSRDGNPLRAKVKRFEKGASLKAALLSGIAESSRILNLPRSQTIFNGVGYSTSTVDRDPNPVAGMVGGVTDSLVNQEMAKIERQRATEPNTVAYIVEKGTEVQVFVTRSFTWD